MKYALALGSNLGDRLVHLNQALSQLGSLGRIVALGPALENPPWLPPQAPRSWFSFFLNTALVLETNLAPLALLQATQKIEENLGRPADHPNWSPRTIDIDLLFDLDGKSFDHPRLTLPHKNWAQRNFVLAPLTHILPQHRVTGDKTILELYREEKNKLPAVMGILNVTPDSFSQEKRDGLDQTSISNFLKHHFNEGTPYIDIGAESTRPGATPLNDQQEWARLEPVLQLVHELKRQNPFVQISLDTYHAANAERAIAFSVDILNDVNGLRDPRMREVARDYKSVVLMHSLTVPADKRVTWPENTDAVKAMEEWLSTQLESLSFLKPENIFWDPGFGFGKTPHQCLELVRHFEVFNKYPVRSVVGHSRKSFLNLWTQKAFADRDGETLALSQILSAKGADVLRVHNVALHRDFFKSAMAGSTQ
jgi:dihydropteroate synthase/2-amino-4-hydroxy-6-hydroxymethyldihydropteridine diphosphokinase